MLAGFHYTSVFYMRREQLLAVDVCVCSEPLIDVCAFRAAAGVLCVGVSGGAGL